MLVMFFSSRDWLWQNLFTGFSEKKKKNEKIIFPILAWNSDIFRRLEIELTSLISWISDLFLF